MKLQFTRAIAMLMAGIFSLSINSASAKDGVIYKAASGVNFVNGGIGEEEAADIRRSAKHFSLQLLFTAGAVGGWITDVSVLIIDSNGITVFTKKTAGPRLYIDLPAGKYQVIGKYLDVRQSQIVTLTAGKPQRVILNWKDEAAEVEDNSKEEN